MMNQTLHAETVDCIITVTADQPTLDVLRLNYSVHNRSLLPLYLCNQFWENTQLDLITGQEVYEITPNLVHVQATSDQVSVGMTVIDLPLSDGAKIFYIPCSTRLEPNQDYTASVNLALPLIPYGQPKARFQQRPSISLAARFELGYFLGDSQIEKHVTKVVTTQGTAYNIAPFLSKAQQIIAVGPFSSPIAVTKSLEEVWVPWR